MSIFIGFLIGQLLAAVWILHCYNRLQKRNGMTVPYGASEAKLPVMGVILHWVIIVLVCTLMGCLNW